MIKITREFESLPVDFIDLYMIMGLCFMNKKRIGRQIFSQLKIYFSNLPKSTKEILITLMFSAYYYNKYTSFYYDLTAPLLHTTNDDYLFQFLKIHMD